MSITKHLLGFAGLAVAASGHAAILTEGFDSFASLSGAGWVITNNSTPVGATSWFAGDNSTAFPAQAGAAGSYVAASFLSTDPLLGGSVSTWLISPVVSTTGGATLSFYTRTADAGFADGLQVLYSAGAGSATSTFTNLLLSVGTVASPYNTAWTQYTVTLPTLAAGRFAFRYIGDGLTNDYVGIDTVNVSAVPEAGTWALMLLGIAGLALVRRRTARVLALGTLGAVMSVGAANAGSLRVVKDPVSGQLRAPTAEEAVAMDAAAPAKSLSKISKAAPVEIKRADGSSELTLDESSMSYSVMTRNADGTMTLACVEGKDAADALVKGKKSKIAAKEHRHDVK